MQVSGISSNSYLQQLQQMLFNKADANGDGSLSVDEFEATGSDNSSGSANSADKSKADQLFKSIDTNGDGSASQDELGSFFTKLSADTQASLLQFQQQASDRASNFIGKADTDGDGAIDLAEFTAAGPNGSQDSDRAKEIFGKIDTNGDGKVTQDELTAFDEAKGPKGHHGGGHHHMAASGDASSQDGSAPSLADLLSQIADGSGGSTDSSVTSTAAAPSASNGTDGTGNSGLPADFAKQIEAYLSQMLSSTANAASTDSKAINLVA
jgi:Ca2+-binding EF-hand superfamily protein